MWKLPNIKDHAQFPDLLRLLFITRCEPKFFYGIAELHFWSVGHRGCDERQRAYIHQRSWEWLLLPLRKPLHHWAGRRHTQNTIKDWPQQSIRSTQVASVASIAIRAKRALLFYRPTIMSYLPTQNNTPSKSLKLVSSYEQKHLQCPLDIATGLCQQGWGRYRQRGRYFQRKYAWK